MILILILIILFIPLVSSYSQFEEEVGWANIEIYIGITGLNSNEYVYFTLESVSSVYKGGPLVGTNFILTQDEYKKGRYPSNINSVLGNSDFSVTTTNWLGFSFIPSRVPNIDLFAYGLYKLSVFRENNINNHFYIDYRDNLYGSYTSNCPQCADIWIKYDADDNSFYVSNTGSAAHSVFNSYWVHIGNNSLLNIWDIQNQYNSPITSYFPQYWQNSLAVIDENFHPKLIWSTDANVNVTHYKIYRSVS